MQIVFRSSAVYDLPQGWPKERNPRYARSFEMRNRSQNMILALAIALGCSSMASAQTTQPSNGAYGPTPRDAPDFSGVWMKDRPPATTGLEYWVYQFNLEEPPMTAWGEAQYKTAKSSLGPHGIPLAETNDPVYHGC